MKKDNIARQKFKKGDHVRIHQPSDKYKSANWSKDICPPPRWGGMVIATSKKSKDISMSEKVFKPSNDYSVFEYKLGDKIGRYMGADIL